ncbi:MAG: HAD family hydrolase [Fidelibacterota bacterium]
MHARFPLYLFDIDGTLISPGPEARRILNKAIQDTIGVDPDLQLQDVAGFTDRTIVGQALQRYGCKNHIPAVTDEVIGRYLIGLEKHFRESDRPFVFPDALHLIEKIEEQGGAIGLLTGNVRAGAEIKLGRFNLWHRFAFGIFGDEAEDRLGLGSLVPERARKILGQTYRYEEMIIVGDTEQDARLASAYGMQSIIVCRYEPWRNNIRLAGADRIVRSLDEITSIC